MIQHNYDISGKKKIAGADADVALEYLIAKKYTDKAQNADSQGKAFNIPFDEFRTMILTGKCYYTNKPVTDLNKASIERIDPDKGYISGNVCMVDSDVNQFKGATIDVFMRSRFKGNLPACLAEVLNICNKMISKLGFDMVYDAKTDTFKVYGIKTQRQMRDQRMLVDASNIVNGIFKEYTIIKVDNVRSKYHGKPGVVLKNYIEGGKAVSYKVKLLTDGCPKIKVKKVSKMDLR